MTLSRTSRQLAANALSAVGSPSAAAGGTLRAGADFTFGRISFDAGLSKHLTPAGDTVTLAGVPNAGNVFVGLDRVAGATGVQKTASNLLLPRDLNLRPSGTTSQLVAMFRT